MSEIVKATAISVKLRRRQVLREIDLSVSAGEFIGLVGPNGAGKSTLLRVLAGLLKPETGAVHLDGIDIRQLQRRELAREIAFLPQDQTVHWGISAKDVAYLGRLPHRQAGQPLNDIDHEAVARALEAMDIQDLSERPVTELSGGERARVLIARALAQDPRVLLADEPATGLDAVHQLELFSHLRRLADDGRAIVVVLHDLSLAARFCDRLVIIDAGQVHADGTGDAVLSAQVLADVYGMSAHLGEVDGVPFVIPLASLSDGHAGKNGAAIQSKNQ